LTKRILSIIKNAIPSIISLGIAFGEEKILKMIDAEDKEIYQNEHLST
jgi:hypothetical protein